MKLYLIRHGETTGDVEDRYGGVYDDHLTSRGREQLAHTAKQLEHMQVDVIFSSPLIRAREASGIIKEQVDVEIQMIEGLKERDYGVLTGLTKAEALATYPEAVEAHADPLNTDPEGESFEDFDSRVASALEEILNAGHENACVVAHGGSLKRILHHLGIERDEHIGDGEIIEVTI